MLRKHDTGIQGRGMMNEVARSVLTSHELSTFIYYIDQYEHRGLSVDDLTTALLDLLDTAEKACCMILVTKYTALMWSAIITQSYKEHVKRDDIKSPHRFFSFNVYSFN